jgi:hypothetical protein
LFFFEEYLVSYDKIPKSGAVSIDGPIDGEEDPLDRCLCFDADEAVPRAAPLTAEGNGQILFFLVWIGPAPGEVEPVQLRRALSARAAARRRGVENLIRRRVHFEEQREVQDTPGHKRSIFQSAKKILFFFEEQKTEQQKNRTTERRAA